MNRDKALKIILVLVGLLFVAGIYPLVTSVQSGWRANREDAEPMGISLYVMMGFFMLMAARNPSANRSRVRRISRKKCQSEVEPPPAASSSWSQARA